MRTLHTLSSLALGLMTATAVAHAQGTSNNGSLDARYQAELAQCQQLATPEAQANCRREAGAALQTARKGELDSGSNGQLQQQNATKRCQNLPPNLREDCMLNMQQGANTQIQGSVSGGGILRRTEITIPGEPAQPAQPAPQPAPSLSPAEPAAVVPGVTAPAPTHLPGADGAPR